MRNPYLLRWLTCLALLLCGWPNPVAAAPFTPGNFVVARVGDGSASLSSAATAVFLDEYTPAGVLVQTIDLPTSLSANNRILTASGNATSELNLTRSTDGRYLVLTGYSAAPGTPSVAASTTTDITRVIGRIAADGTVDTNTSTADAFSGTNIRAAATTDGQSFYAVGGNSGVRYVTLGSSTNTSLNTAPTNIRYVSIADGKLYISTASSPYIGISQVGTGLPTTAGQPVTVLPGFPATAAGASPYAFYFADLSTTEPGADVVYVADDRSSSGIQKWSLVSGTWVLNGTITGSPVPALRGLNGMTSGTTVSLVATGGGGLFFLTDNAGHNAAPSTTTLPAAIATAAANTAFRGVAFAPVTPAPTVVSFSPASGQVGDLVTVTGTNFTGASALTLNGVAMTGFTVVNATTITFAVPAGATTGTIAVTTLGGTATSTSTFTVITPNPVPTITGLSPSTTTAGSAAFPLTVTGTGFVSGSVVTFNGAALATTFVSATQLTATVPVTAVATAGTYAVTVTNAAPGGGTSAASTFTVTTPAPTIVSFAPVSGPVGTSVTVTGTNFTGATAVTLNGVAVTGFTVVNATTITFSVPAGATSGTIAVTTPGGTATSAGTFTLVTTPTITSLTPNTQVVGGPALSLTIAGTGFTATSTVSFNGVTYTSSSSTATSIAVTIPATALATVGSFPVTVTNAAGTSNALTFTVTAPPAPTITSFTPTSGGPTTLVTVTGTNFTGATAVRIGSFAAGSFTVVNATTITFTVPTGTGSITGLIQVETPGGTATSTANFNLVSATLASQAMPGLSVYPNPATDRLTVVLPQAGAATVALHDLTGRVVLVPAALGADQLLHLPASLATGVYFLEVRQGSTTAIRRIEKR